MDAATLNLGGSVECIARDSSGNVLGSKMMCSSKDPAFMEAWAVRLAVELSMERD